MKEAKDVAGSVEEKMKKAVKHFEVKDKKLEMILDHFPVQGGPFVGQDQAVGGPEVQPDYAVLPQDH